MKVLSVLSAFLVLVLAGCSTTGSSVAERARVEMPEPLLGLNVFVATDPLKIPAGGVNPEMVPNPRKPIPFDDKAESETQQMVFRFAMELRENIEEVFRPSVPQTYSFVAGASYRWDELRRDQRNYSLVIWPTRESTTSQQVDVRAVLVHEATGRRVWEHVFKDPYRTKNAVLGGYTRVERLRIVRAMSEKMLSDLAGQGVLSPAAQVASR